MADEAASDACLAARAAFVVPGGRPRRRPVGVRREGVDVDAIAWCANLAAVNGPSWKSA